MRYRRRIATTICAALGALASMTVPCRADIPPGYAGTPFKGKPQAIPGRIEFENFDEGGPGVAFLHHVGTQSSGADYRPGGLVPPICATNVISMDTWTDGTIYPSAANPKSYYVCQTHAGEWVKMTVSVAQTGTYILSSAFASNIANIDIDLRANDIDLTPGGFKAPATANYHVWKKYDDFARVDLKAGLWVLQFTATAAGLQYDYLEFKLAGDTSDAGAAPPDGAAPEGGPDAFDATSPSSSTGQEAGAAIASDASSDDGLSPGAGGSSGTGASGTTGAVDAPPGSGGGSTQVNGGPASPGSGCSVGGATGRAIDRSSSAGISFALLLSALVWRRPRSTSTHRRPTLSGRSSRRSRPTSVQMCIDRSRPTGLVQSDRQGPKCEAAEFIALASVPPTVCQPMRAFAQPANGQWSARSNTASTTPSRVHSSFATPATWETTVATSGSTEGL
jgi:hypothetical protein